MEMAPTQWNIRQVEALLFAAQEQAIPTNIIKHRIFGQEDAFPLCRLCGLCDVTIDHLTSSCSFITQSAYKHRHDNVAKFFHWKLLDQYQFLISIGAGGNITLSQLWKIRLAKFCGFYHHN